MKSSLKFLVVLTILLGTIFACQKNILSPQTEDLNSPTFSIEEAKSNYETNHTVFSNNLLACGTLPNLQITPEWTKSKQHNFPRLSVVETPLLWNNKQLGKLKRSENDAIVPNKNSKEVETVTSLITAKDSNGIITNKIMIISADETYLKNNGIKNNDYKHKDPKFTGDVAYYNEDGSFYIGWRFLNGKIIRKVGSLTCNNSTLSTRLYEVCTLFEQCTDWYVNGVYDGTSCYYFTECTYYSTGGGYGDPYGYTSSGGGDGSTTTNNGTSADGGPSQAFINASKKATAIYQKDFMCVKYQDALKRFILKEGWKYDIQNYKFCTITNKFGDIIEYNGTGRISENGLHKYTVVDGYVFDNKHPNGVPQLEFYTNLAGPAGSYPSGFNINCN